MTMVVMLRKSDTENGQEKVRRSHQPVSLVIWLYSRRVVQLYCLPIKRPDNVPSLLWSSVLDS